MACYKDKFGKAMAVRILNESRRRRKHGNKNRKETRLYYCEECKAYHLTSQVPKQKGWKIK